MSEKIIYIKDFEVKGKMGRLKNKVKVTSKIACSSTAYLMKDPKVHVLAAGVGLAQGLKYGGSFKRGVKGAAMTYSAAIGAQVLQNVAHNIEVIKKA